MQTAREGERGRERADGFWCDERKLKRRGLNDKEKGLYFRIMNLGSILIILFWIPFSFILLFFFLFHSFHHPFLKLDSNKTTHSVPKNYYNYNLLLGILSILGSRGKFLPLLFIFSHSH